MPRLIAALIRHGDYHQLPDTPSAHQPFPLNQAGEGQARAAVGRVREVVEREHWQLHPVIDSSNLLRAWQTAEIIGDGLDLDKIRGFDELAERGVGSAANLTISQIEEILQIDPRFEAPPKDWKSNSRYRLPLQGAESLLEAGERVAGHLRRCMGELADEAEVDSVKLIVGHGAAFRHAAYHLGVLAFDDIARLSMYHADPLYLEQLPDGTWRHAAGAWKVRGSRETPMD